MKRVLWISASVAVLAIGTLAVLAQNQTRTVMGPEGMLYGAKVSSWAKVDGSGKVMEAGVSIPMSAIEKAPLPGPNDKPQPEGGPGFGPKVVLEFPDVVKQTTFLNHLQLWYEGFGHPPERYLTPHFDFHFFGIPAAEVGKIDCKNLTPPALELTPKGFAPAVPPGANAAEFCVPLMGFHGLELAEFAAPGQLKPGLFDKVMISGFYGGRYIFTEPMITRDFLLSKKEYSTAVSHPAKVGRKALYPTTFKASYDAAANAYQFVYGGFEGGE